MTKEEIRTDNTETLKNALRRIEELEKENKTISRKANEAIADKLLITAKYNEILNDLNQQNDKLQKENAELKSELTNKADTNHSLVEQMAEQNEQLEHAKEHIRTLISCLIDWVQEGDKDYCYIADAEQFLKEETK